MEDSVKIVSLQMENFKYIARFEHEFNESEVLEVTGKNGQGKSSVIDAVVSAIGGKTRTPIKPLKNGERRGSITLKLDNGMTVERKFGDKGSTEVAVFAGGSKMAKPQEVLNELLSCGFNVSELLTDNKKLKSTLLSVSDLNIDWSKGWPKMADSFENSTEEDALAFMDAQVDKIKETAKIHRAAVKNEKVEFDLARQAPGAGKPVKAVSVSELLAERDAAMKEVREQESARSQVEAIKQQAVSSENEIARLKDLLEAEEKKLKTTLSDLEEAAAAVELLPAPPDIAAIDEKIANAESINTQAANYANFSKVRDRLNASEKELLLCKDAIEDIEAFKKRTLENASFPVEGLSVDGDIVTWNGDPISQVGEARALDIAIAIAMATNPKLRLIVLDRAEAFDKDTLKRVVKRLQDNNFQGIIVRVGEEPHTPGGLIMEAGKVIWEGE